MQAEARAYQKASEVVPLAMSRGKRRSCELCEGAARLQCNGCRVTFYCNAEHQQADWVGIHERICQLVVPIRTSTLVSLRQSGQNGTELKLELIEICRSVAQSKLSEGKNQEALPAAQLCLRCSKEVYGPSSIQMVPSYLLLAEANMGLGNLTQVAELLSQAEWAGLKSPESSVHHQLYRSMGRLHTATGNLEAALFHFANYIYFTSEEYGVDSTETSCGYFLMAGVFAKRGDMSIACSMYSQVAQTWHCWLTKLFEAHVQNPDMVLEQSLDEALQMLNIILDFEQNSSRKDSTQIAMAAHCLAMLYFFEGDYQQALGFGSIALQASQLISEHDLTEAILGLLQLVQSRQTEEHPGSDEYPVPAMPIPPLTDLLPRDIC